MQAAQTTTERRLTTVDIKDLHSYLLTKNKQLAGRLMELRQRQYDGDKGSGTVSTLRLADQTSDVQVTFFNQTETYERLRVGECYYVPLAGSRIKPANQKFNTARSDVEITLGRDAAIRAAGSAVSMSMPSHAYKFVSIDTLADTKSETQIDLVGVVVSLAAPSTITRKKDGRPFVKCEFELSDASEISVGASLLLNEGEAPDLALGMVVALRGTIARFKGLTSVQVNGILRNPKIEAADVLAELWRTKRWAPTALPRHYEFVALDKLSSEPVDAHVDVLGVVTAVKVCTGVPMRMDRRWRACLTVRRVPVRCALSRSPPLRIPASMARTACIKSSRSPTPRSTAPRSASS